MKIFLLIAGENYYPQRGTGNWIGTFTTIEEAEGKVDKIKMEKQSWLDENNVWDYKINGESYDWYEIVDLRKWI